jgi:hypothetical protein
VFHCTTEDHVKEIFAEGTLKPGKGGTVSFTEIPIGELDRMKYRHRGAKQVAIGFPRGYVQSLGLTPVWYLKHNPTILQALAVLKTSDPKGYKALLPFIDENDDVAPFQEVRTTSPVKIEKAVWILTTNRDDDLLPVIPDIDKFQAKHGRISKSYWHRSHQMEILSEWQFTRSKKNERGMLEEFQCFGEHYWRQEVTKEKELRVVLPAHQRKILFEVTQLEEHAGFEGPWRFIDVARSIVKALLVAGENIEDILPYRLIKDVASL